MEEDECENTIKVIADDTFRIAVVMRLAKPESLIRKHYYLGCGLLAGSPGTCMMSGSGSSRALKNSCVKIWVITGVGMIVDGSPAASCQMKPAKSQAATRADIIVSRADSVRQSYLGPPR